MNKQPQLAPPKPPTRSSRPPYTHWIHCNVCYEQYMHKTRLFYLLACDHVTCERCTQDVSETSVNGPQIYKCPLCDCRTRGCKLGNEMPTHIKELFHPEPYLDGLNTCRVKVFQEKHRRRFVEFLEREVSTLEHRRKDIILIKDQAKKYFEKYQQLKTERKLLEKRVIAIKQQRKDMEEKKKSKRSTSSDTSSHSSVPKRLQKTISTDSGITSFSNYSSNTSFVL